MADEVGLEATAPAGTPVAFSSTDILRVEDGCLAEYWINSDTLLLLTQVGNLAIGKHSRWELRYTLHQQSFNPHPRTARRANSNWADELWCLLTSSVKLFR